MRRCPCGQRWWRSTRLGILARATAVLPRARPTRRRPAGAGVRGRRVALRVAGKLARGCLRRLRSARRAQRPRAPHGTRRRSARFTADAHYSLDRRRCGPHRRRSGSRSERTIATSARFSGSRSVVPTTSASYAASCSAFRCPSLSLSLSISRSRVTFRFHFSTQESELLARGYKMCAHVTRRHAHTHRTRSCAHVTREC